MNSTQQIFSFSKEEPDFYIQLKGLNAGKPLYYPIPNSAGIVVNKTIMDRRFLYYTVLYLFNAGHFKAFQRGSVIPFIRQPDIRFVIYKHFLSMASQQPKQIHRAVVALRATGTD